MFVHRPSAPLVACLLGLACGPAAVAQITFRSGVTLPNGGEIVSFANGTLLATNSVTGSAAVHAIQAYTLTASGSLTVSGSFDVSAVFGGAANISSVSSVLADARGFGVATVIPTLTGSANFGRIAFFSTTTGEVLKTLDVGYHPDSVSITPDGMRLLVANEGEFVSASADTTFARPGSVSVVSLSGVATAADLSSLTQASVSTYDFSAGNLASGVSISGLRNNRLDTPNVKDPNAADIEPEYIAATNDRAYVTLQENNAIAVLDFTTGTYEAIHQLGAITKAIDASDRDGPSGGPAIAINDTIRGLPMPDTMVKFSRGGTTYLVTANEGDARPDDGDQMRINQSGTSGRPSIDATVKSTLDGLYGGNFTADAALGRLTILRDQGDTDLDGDIDQPTMLGTRSFSIWNSASGTLAFDSGSMIEQWVAANDPSVFNINSGSSSLWDTRSDDKGPEPEALAFGSIDGRDYVFVGAERQNGIFQFDITDFTNVSIVGYFNPVSSTLDSGGAFISPESIQFLASGAAGNPTGQDLLIVGFEGTGGNGSIGVFAVPEPSTWLLAASGGVLAAAAAWRRRRPARPRGAAA
jgi:2',3'-cyclic-nucleotide 2'-phosphodiesterase/3'-nucleotidase/5'-nucleotidase